MVVRKNLAHPDQEEIASLKSSAELEWIFIIYDHGVSIITHLCHCNPSLGGANFCMRFILDSIGPEMSYGHN
jgi:hypothetical protein